MSSARPEFFDIVAFCKSLHDGALGRGVGRMILWSEYKVCPLVNSANARSCLVGGQPTQVSFGNDIEKIDESHSNAPEHDQRTYVDNIRSERNHLSDDEEFDLEDNDLWLDERSGGLESLTLGSHSTSDIGYIKCQL